MIHEDQILLKHGTVSRLWPQQCKPDAFYSKTDEKILQFEIYAPLMVARQWWKYVVGSVHYRGTGVTIISCIRISF